MNLSNVYLTTLIPEFPRIYNYNNQVFKSYLDVIYNETTGVVIVPINTPGRVKAATGEFVNVIVDNLTVKNQYTNLYDNVTTVDQDYYYTYIGADASYRDASTMSTQENSRFKYIDVNQPYYKILNDVSLAFKASQLGQEFQIIFDISTALTKAYNILLDPSISGTFKTLTVSVADASKAWIKLIAVENDASFGTTWVVKQYGGTYSIV